MTPDAALVVTADSAGVAKVWDCGTGDCVLTVRAANEVSGIDGVAIAESRAPFATASMAESAATVWSLESGEPVRIWHHPEVRRVGFPPSGRFVMTVFFGGSQMMWDLDSGDCVRTINDREITLDVAFSLDGELMLLAPLEGPVKLYSMRSAECVLELNHGNVIAFAVAITPRGWPREARALYPLSTEQGACSPS